MDTEQTVLEYLIVIFLSQTLSALGSACDKSQVSCHDGIGCYEKSQRCNGKSECFDGSDEAMCTLADCPIKFCHTSQKCIDVWDTLCECLEGQCRIDETCCSDGSGCYTNEQKCDGTMQCKNGADEEICVLASGPQGFGKNSAGRAVVYIIAVIAALAFVIGIILYCRYKQTARLQRFAGSQWYDIEPPTPNIERRTESVNLTKHEHSNTQHYSEVRQGSPPSYSDVV